MLINQRRLKEQHKEKSNYQARYLPFAFDIRVQKLPPILHEYKAMDTSFY